MSAFKPSNVLMMGTLPACSPHMFNTQRCYAELVRQPERTNIVDKQLLRKVTVNSCAAAWRGATLCARRGLRSLVQRAPTLPIL